jgi:hypothetical protein
VLARSIGLVSFAWVVSHAPLLAAAPFAGQAELTRHFEIAPGVAVSVQIVAPSARIDLDDSPLVPQLEELRSEFALGDARAATAIYEGIERCRTVHRDEISLDNAIRLARTERQLLLSDSSQPTPLATSVDIEMIIRDFLIRPFEFCLGTNDALVAQSRDWLAKAFERGDKFAAEHLINYAHSASEQLSIWRVIWSYANPSALPHIADILLARSRGAASEPDDVVNAYAHQLLFVRLQQNARLTEAGPVRSRLLKRSLESLTAIERTLGEADIKRGAVIASQILAGNGGRSYPL